MRNIFWLQGFWIFDFAELEKWTLRSGLASIVSLTKNVRLDFLGNISKELFFGDFATVFTAFSKATFMSNYGFLLMFIFTFCIEMEKFFFCFEVVHNALT